MSQTSNATRTMYGAACAGPTETGGGAAMPMYDGNFNGTGDFVSDLSACKAKGVKTIVKFVGAPGLYTDSNSAFSLAMWQNRMAIAAAKTSAAQMHAFVDDGTLLANWLIDDFKTGTAVFAGGAPTFAEVESMASTSKSYWSRVPTFARAENQYMKSLCIGASASNYTYLDAGWAMWHKKFGSVLPWWTNHINDGRAVGLGAMAGFNILNGGSGTTAPWNVHPNQANAWGMSPQEIDACSAAFSSLTYLIGSVIWAQTPLFDKIDYWDWTSIQTALQRYANQHIGRVQGPLNWRGSSPSGSTDTTSGSTITVGGNWIIRDDGASTVARGNNIATLTVTPPQSFTTGDLHCLLVHSRDSNKAVDTPSGWSLTKQVSGNSAQGGELTLFHKIGSSNTEGSLGLTFTGNYAATSQMARWFVFSNNTATSANLVAATSSGRTWPSQTSMGPVDGLTSTASDVLVLVCAARCDDFGGGSVDENVMSATTGATFGRLFSTGNVSGLDQGFFVDYRAVSGPASIDTKWWSQTSGTAAGAGVGFMVAFAPLSVVSGQPPVIQGLDESNAVTISVASTLSFTMVSTGSTPFTYSTTSGPSNITLGASTGAFQWSPVTAGDYYIILRSTNSYGFDEASMVVSVVSSGGTATGGSGTANAAPAITNPGNKSVTAHDLLSFIVSATDADGDPISYSLDAGAPTGTFIDADTGQFIWIPSGEQGPGTYPIVVVAFDGQAESRSTFTVTVADTAWTRVGGPSTQLSRINDAGNQFTRIL